MRLVEIKSIDRKTRLPRPAAENPLLSTLQQALGWARKPERTVMESKCLRESLYLEDLQVGQEFLSAEHSLDAGQIIAYARQFDPQPFHLDEDAAKDSFFQGLAASGWHTMSITMKLLVQSMPFAKGIIGTGGEIAWPRPTRPNDILQVKSTIKAVRPSRSRPDRGMVQTRSLTLNQHGEVLQELTANLLVFRNPRARADHRRR